MTAAPQWLDRDPNLIAPHALLLDTLRIAVPCKMQELAAMTWDDRAQLAAFHAQRFKHADVMLYEPSAKPGQISHLITILAVLALNNDGGVTFAGETFMP